MIPIEHRDPGDECSCAENPHHGSPPERWATTEEATRAVFEIVTWGRPQPKIEHPELGRVDI